MKIALITPHYYPAVRGNAVTVRRIGKYLVLRGCEVRTYSLDTVSVQEIFSGIRGYGPDLIHAFHGYTGGRIARLAAQGTGIPYIITLTGTDVYEALDDSRKMDVHAALRDAVALVAFHKSVKKRLAEHFPTMAAKTTIIPQGVELPGEDCSGLGGFPFPAGKFTFLLPAGLRPIKNVLFPLAPLAELYAREPSLRFILAGPLLDARYAAEVMERLERYPFAHYLGGIGHDAIGCLFRKADAVLNTSLFEGGMANSVLEALAFGKPVLANDIEGNRSLVKDGVTGLLYRSEDDFREKAWRLLADGKLREKLGERGRRFVLKNFPPEREAEAYVRLYEAVRSEE
ncbi:MAG: group 1 glycosyl [Geobacteraceae bacterium]|nr:MAG: group 1 glycosyl [Geobacteraceae bacterium]